MKVIGDNGITLRAVEVCDAGFIFKLRIDPDLSKHLSQTTGTVEDQASFIEKYKKREASGLEYYFIIEKDGNSVGTLRLYNIDYNKSVFTWGSWIIERGNSGEVAISSAYMSYIFGFDYLNLENVFIDVRKENKRAFDYYSIYSNFLYEDELNYYLDFKKSEIHRYVDKFKDRIPNNVIFQASND